MITPPVLAGDADTNSKYIDKLSIVCDMGEGYGKWKMGPDEEIMPLIDIANIACGFHAGDFNIMAKTVKLAKAHGVKVGSHPGLPDLLGFGRRKWDIPADEVFNLIMYQTGALKAFLDAEDMPLYHIKPHGELFYYVARDEGVMRALMKAAKIFNVPVIAAKNKRIQEVADEMGVELIQELYVDVDYDNDGHLAPVNKWRPKNGEIIYDLVKTAGMEDTITSIDETVLHLNFGKNPFLLCLHSDMPTALDNINASRKAIQEVNAIKFSS